MKRKTIDFGIDLGTTNSAIAVLKGTDVDVFRNNEGHEYTPSVVWQDQSGQLYVGRTAKSQAGKDGKNCFSEFKTHMGKEKEFQFETSGQTTNPEMLSAEILKSLKQDVSQRTGEDVQAAVITVPAAFELPQCEATNRAAKLAGFSESPLLQEPVAAALSYGFQSESDKVFWLVFDIGGGTFDSAVMQVRDGVIQVVCHGGDNHLGGKDIDEEIMDQIFIPAMAKKYNLSDFNRGNRKYDYAMAKLKQEAEDGKILLSRAMSTRIEIDFLGTNEQGEPMSFSYDLTRSELEKICKPIYARAINICKKVLTEKHLGSADIEKVILVGGPTLSPILRKTLADPDTGLGINLEFSVDPLTVVAQGAAIFAGTQRLIQTSSEPVQAGHFSLESEYKPIGTDTEVQIGGKVSGQSEMDFSGYTIEFINTHSTPPWRSGEIGLTSQGTFMTELFAEKGLQSTFEIVFLDPMAKKLHLVPDSIDYTYGISIEQAPLIHSVGIALANNEVAMFFEKGISLPAKHRRIHRIAFDARKSDEGVLIKIPLIEGEYKRADRNHEIGAVFINSNEISRNVPAGSEVEITIEIDRSRLTTAKVYIPILDEEFEAVSDLVISNTDPVALKADVKKEKERLKKAKEKANILGDPDAKEALDKIKNENIEHELDHSLTAATADSDSADKCCKRLLDLKILVDELEDALEWPSALEEANTQLEETRKVVEDSKEMSAKQNFAVLEKETRQAIQAKDLDSLRRKSNELLTFRVRLLQANPGFWVGMLRHLESERSKMRDQSLAEQLITQANRAISGDDIQSLKAAVQQLISLLPAEKQGEMGLAYGSTII